MKRFADAVGFAREKGDIFCEQKNCESMISQNHVEDHIHMLGRNSPVVDNFGCMDESCAALEEKQDLLPKIPKPANFVWVENYSLRSNGDEGEITIIAKDDSNEDVDNTGLLIKPKIPPIDGSGFVKLNLSSFDFKTLSEKDFSDDADTNTQLSFRQRMVRVVSKTATARTILILTIIVLVQIFLTPHLTSMNSTTSSISKDAKED